MEVRRSSTGAGIPRWNFLRQAGGHLFALWTQRDGGRKGVITSMLNHKQIQELLDLLCVKYGFCLPPKQDEIVKRPAEDVLGCAEAVIAAEGLDPVTLDRLCIDK